MSCGAPHSKSGGQSMPQRMVNQMPHYDKRILKDRRPKMKPMKKAKAIKWI